MTSASEPFYGFTSNLKARWRSVISFLLIGLCLLLSGCSSLPFFGQEKDFELNIQGNQKLKEAISDELMEQKKNDVVLRQFNQQQKIDRYQADTIRRYLRSEGYYANEVTHRRKNDTTFYDVATGPRYTIAELRIEFPEGMPAPSKDILALEEGQPLRAEDVLAARSTIRDWIYVSLCPYQVQVDYDAKVFHRDQTASVTYSLRPAQEVEFGQLTISGQETVEADYLQDRLPVQQGDCFNRQRIDRARLALLQTNLVANVDAQVGEPIEGQVPVNFNVSERNHRTLRAGVNYDMDLGPGLSLGWEHRNLLGRAERLDISSRFNEVGRSVEAEFTVPHYRRANQTLVIHSDILREDPDAYLTTAGSVGATLGRQVNREFFASAGVNLRYSQVVEDGIEESYLLFSTPLTVEYDRRNDILNPVAGWRVALAVEPFTDLSDTDRRFTKSRFTASAFHTVPEFWGQPTFAAQFATGTITGVTRDDVPADLRFYVGGGGSVRGYAYQSLGDITDGAPDGGRSFTELAFETRVRVTGNWGAVIFADGGYAYPEELPEFGQELRWGMGAGIRYLTDFAPIRLDVGFPLDRRPEIDDSFQLYISIGQAF